MVSGGRLLVGEMEVSWFTNRPPLLCLPWQVVIICFLQIDASQSVVGVLALGYGSRLFGGELVVSWFNNRPPLVCLPWQIVIFCSCKMMFRVVCYGGVRFLGVVLFARWLAWW